MNASDLRPVHQLAQIYGVKMLGYGGPGTGKTPLITTAPNPVVCFTEPGLLSIRTSNLPGYCAETFLKFKDFVDWVCKSHEARQFDTVCIDSVSQAAENKLDFELARNKDGRKAYGEMSRDMMTLMNMLYYLPYKHVWLVAKETNIEIQGVIKLRPYFPGQDLHVKIPHLYDEIFRVSYKQGQDGKSYRVFETQDSFNFVARDRIGKLAAVELADIGQVIQKCMS